MKKVTLLILAALLAAVPAFGANVLSETFSYADGDLTTVGPLWTAHSGATTGPVQVVSGKAVFGGGAEDVNRVFSAVLPNTAPVYACFELSLTGTAPVVGSGYFFHFRPGGGSFVYMARLRLEPPTGAGDYTLNINNGANALGTAWGSDLSYGTTYTITLKYDPQASTSTLWVDAASEAGTSVSHTDAVAAQPTGEVALRQYSGTPVGTTVDNIEVGTSFADVCPQPTPTIETSFGRIKAMYR